MALTWTWGRLSFRLRPLGSHVAVVCETNQSALTHGKPVRSSQLFHIY